ncbi:hypothetical protein K449DRAFT_183733 [Hypoxylon sp. EC38]|nr:hypothetical protein K449DRAFT_183733 [Hypoxylon sp. EC38]
MFPPWRVLDCIILHLACEGDPVLNGFSVPAGGNKFPQILLTLSRYTIIRYRVDICLIHSERYVYILLRLWRNHPL